MVSCRRNWAIGLVAAALVGQGCGGGLGPPEHFPTARVTGVITVRGEPVGKGWVEFFPVEGTRGNLCSAPIDANGRFQAEAVAVGRNLVGVAGAPLSPGLRSRFHPFRSTIRRNIGPTPAGDVVIDLYDEAINAQAATRSP